MSGDGPCECVDKWYPQRWLLRNRFVTDENLNAGPGRWLQFLPCFSPAESTHINGWKEHWSHMTIQNRMFLPHVLYCHIKLAFAFNVFGSLFRILAVNLMSDIFDFFFIYIFIAAGLYHLISYFYCRQTFFSPFFLSKWLILSDNKVTCSWW